MYRLAAQRQTSQRQVPAWMVGAVFVAAVISVIALLTGPQFGSAMGTVANASLAMFILIPSAALGALILWPGRGYLLRLSTPLPGIYFLVMAVAVGLPALGLLTMCLGYVGALPWAPFVLLLGSVIAGYAPLSSHLKTLKLSGVKKAVDSRWLLFALAIAIPVAVLITAACFPAGTLWHTEGKGYDVLEYHLQLPRQFIASGRTAPVHGNIYSYLPLNIEMVFTLMGELLKILPGWGGLYSLIYGSQFLMVAVTAITTLAVGLAPVQLSWPGRAVAMLLFICTPWVIVIGSLAYNDPAVLLLAAVALPLAIAGDSRRVYWMVGLLLGLAVGVKMTAGISIALPVAAVWVARRRWRDLLLVIVLSTAVYAPWMVRSMAASHTKTSIGNPVFPLFAHTLGMDHWSNSLAARFDRGHTAPARDDGLLGHLRAMADQWFLDRQFGAGIAAIADAVARHPGYPGLKTPWFLRFGVIWLALFVGIAIAATCGVEAWLLLLVGSVQLITWLVFTQIQARFLVPIILPSVWLTAMALRPIPKFMVLLTAGLVVQLGFLLVLLRSENGTFLGGPYSQVIGRYFELPDMWLISNHPGQVLAPYNLASARSRIYLEGFDAPLYVQGHIIYNTVFNRNKLARYYAAHGAHATIHWLQKKHVRLVVFDWSEIARLGHTYGFNKVVTPQMAASLMKYGLRPLNAQLAPAISIFVVPRP
jgi:hypothetical protein